ncbi:MAG: thioesterase family protein [Alphaproteobacteria bacterium]
MTTDAPLALYEDEVRPEWIDLNGHMNVAYYVLAFDYATDRFFTHVGVGARYLEEKRHSMFALEAHVTYQRELHAGDPLRVATRLLGYDAKKLHFFHQMYHTTEGYLAATSEWLGLHIDMRARRSAPFPDAIAARLAAIRETHAGLPVPPEVGRVIGLASRSKP